MAQEALPIPLTAMPEVTRLAREVNETGRALLVQVGSDVVRLSPGKPRRALRKRPSPEDIVAALSVAGAWKDLVDAEQLKQDLDAARGSDSSPLEL
jgi:hypothetical protein